MNRAEWAARKGRSSHWCSRATRLAIYIRDGFQCAYCGDDLRGREPKGLALDHLRPKVNGATHLRNDPWHRPTNLVLACRSCNCARKQRPWKQFVRALHPAGQWIVGTSTPTSAMAALVIAEINRKRRRKLNMTLAKSLAGKNGDLTQ